MPHAIPGVILVNVFTNSDHKTDKADREDHPFNSIVIWALQTNLALAIWGLHAPLFEFIGFFGCLVGTVEHTVLTEFGHRLSREYAMGRSGGRAAKERKALGNAAFSQCRSGSLAVSPAGLDQGNREPEIGVLDPEIDPPSHLEEVYLLPFHIHQK